jgi:hypothetical protein
MGLIIGALRLHVNCMTTRGRVVQVRVSAAEERDARRIAKVRGISVAEALRQMVHEEVERILGGVAARGDSPSGTTRGDRS